MMLSYVWAYINGNRVKFFLTVFSLALYFTAVSAAVTMNGSIDAVAALPMKSIGAETVVQKSGKIPNQMTGAIFPHSNAPIYEDEIKKITSAPFVTGYDKALYFWYFDSEYFKSVLGVSLNGGLYADVLKSSLTAGEYPLADNEVLVTEDFIKKNGIGLDGEVVLGADSFRVSGILRSQFSGNIAPADIYMSIGAAQRIAGNSQEMKQLYDIKEISFYNMAVLKTDPLWQGSREQAIKSYDKDYLIFGEESFKNEIRDQLLLMSSSASAAFALLGVLLAAGFSMMVFYGIKSRENDIALLRMLGWRFSALRNHFTGESVISVLLALFIGNILYLVAFLYMSGISVRMELPWDISARPHFLPEENNIERVVTAQLPLDFNIWTHSFVNIAVLTVCVLLAFLVLLRIKNIKPTEFYKG